MSSEGGPSWRSSSDCCGASEAPAQVTARVVANEHLHPAPTSRAEADACPSPTYTAAASGGARVGWAATDSAAGGASSSSETCTWTLSAKLPCASGLLDTTHGSRAALERCRRALSLRAAAAHRNADTHTHTHTHTQRHRKRVSARAHACAPTLESGGEHVPHLEAVEFGPLGANCLKRFALGARHAEIKRQLCACARVFKTRCTAAKSAC